MKLAGRNCLVVACAVLAAGCPSRERRPGDIVVSYLEPSGAATQAGIQTGDRLLSFHRAAAPPAAPEPAEGSFRSCAEVAEIEVEQAPRGAVTLAVERGAKRLALALPAGEWKLGVAVAGRDPGCAELAAARRARDAKQQEPALAAYGRAAAWGGKARRPLFQALALEEKGVIHIERNEFATAEQTLESALRLRQGASPGSLAEAASWHALGRLERLRGDFDRADERFHRALALRVRLAPDSLERAFTLNNLGIGAWTRGNREQAGEIYREALAIIRRRAPNGREEAQVLNNLGLLQRSRSELAAADDYFNAAERILRRVDPGSTDLARIFFSRGALAADRGNYAVSESYHRQAIEHFERLAPNGLEVANGLFNLGLIAGMRQDQQGSESFLRRSLAIRHRLAPGTLIEAEAISALSNQLLATERLDEARALGERAYALRSRLAPRSADTAISLGILAKIALEANDLPRALRLASEEAEHQRTYGAMQLNRGHSQMLLGNIASRQGELETARGHFRAALAIYRSVDPSCAFVATVGNSLGRIERRSGRLDSAEELFRSAVDTLERQIGTLGGTDVQVSLFEASYLPLYQDLLSLQLERGDRAGALRTLERSRARGLLSLIARRDLVFSADLPAPLRQRQERIDQKYSRTQFELARLDEKHRKELESGRRELELLRSERAVLAREISRTAPRYAALKDPKVLDLAGVQGTLDPGTVWLSYSLAEKEATLFVVTRAGLWPIALPTHREDLAREAGIFRSLLLRGAGAPAVEAALRQQGRRLYDLLVAPAERWIGAADRVLVSPDGALHTLPFAALARPDGSFLVDWKPIHSVVSATLYAELRGRRRARAEATTIAAFADPVYRQEHGTPRPGDGPLRRYNLGLPPLLASRAEAQALGALYGAAAKIYTGKLASEHQATHLPASTRIVHFASHALLDRHFPLDSALALSVPSEKQVDGAEDGLLQAWEIFERLRLDADLVTLSACETGLGGAGGGEGLIGLTRAFQYAGARSILASLWSVSDRSTAELMRRFYAALRAGQPKDQALRTAQRALLHDSALGLAHPYHWAGFELIGDWL